MSDDTPTLTGTFAVQLRPDGSAWVAVHVAGQDEVREAVPAPFVRLFREWADGQGVGPVRAWRALRAIGRDGDGIPA